LIFLQEEGPRFQLDLGGSTPGAEPLYTTIVFIALSASSDKIESDWARNSGNFLLRRCPVCECDSIIGHGRRRKQAHDEHHDRAAGQAGCKPTGVDMRP